MSFFFLPKPRGENAIYAFFVSIPWRKQFSASVFFSIPARNHYRHHRCYAYWFSMIFSLNLCDGIKSFFSFSAFVTKLSQYEFSGTKGLQALYKKIKTFFRTFKPFLTRDELSTFHSVRFHCCGLRWRKLLHFILFALDLKLPWWF